MNRRTLLQSVVPTVAGAAMLAADPEAVHGAHTPAAPVTSPAPGFIETRDGAALFYKEWGAGAPVLFVHSWSLHSQLWQYQMIGLASRGFRCIAYDQRGHGRSSDPGRGYDYDALADDLAQVIEKLDLHNVTLIGHSMGCGEIARYVTRHGSSRVSRAVFVSPSLPFAMKTPDNPDGVDESVLERVRSEWEKDFPKWLRENARPFFVANTSEQMIDWTITMCMQASLKALIDCNRAVTQTDFRQELAQFQVPTLLIHGDADVSAPLAFTGRRTAQLIPGCQLKIYEGAPHGLMFTHIDRLNADLLSFLKT